MSCCRACFVLPALVAACGWTSAEDHLISTFFTASRVRDTSELSNVATVMFEPRTQGSVHQFSIARFEEETRRAMQPGRDDSVVTVSLTPPGQPDVDVSGYNVEILGKAAVLDADVHRPDGSDEKRAITVRLERAIARRGEHGFEGRWIVVGVN